MGVAVGEETAWTYEGLWNIKGGCCFTAAGAKWEPDHVATSRSSPFCFLQLRMSPLSTFTRACWISVLLPSSEQRPLKSCQKVPTVSRVGRLRWKFWSQPAGSWPKLGLWWACSSDKTKKTGFWTLVGIKHFEPGDMMRAVIHTRSYTLWQNEVERADGQKLDKAVMVWKSLVWPSERSFLAPCGSAAADSALLSGGSVVSRFKASEWKIYFLRQIQHPE